MAHSNKALTTFLAWCFYSLVLPFLPFLLGIVVAFLQTKNITYSNLLNGTELFLISLTVWASTKNDFDSSELDVKKSVFYYLISRIFLTLMMFSTALVLAVVYVQEHVRDIGFNRELTVNVAIVTAVATSLICIPIQVLIVVADDRHTQRSRRNRSTKSTS